MPRSGALIFNNNFEQVLMVQHMWPNSWGFPQGKMKENENQMDCAIREVYEETSYDIRTHINSDLFVEGWCQGRQTRLYIVESMPSSQVLLPRIKNEIRSYKWFSLNYLWTLDESAINQNGLTSFAYHTLPQIKQFIEDRADSKRFYDDFVSSFFVLLTLSIYENYLRITNY